MAEADLGVRLFMIDELSSPMGLVTSLITLMASNFAAAGSSMGAMSVKMDELTASSALSEENLAVLNLEAEALEANMYGMSTAEFVDGMTAIGDAADIETTKLAENRAEMEALQAQQDATAASMTAMGVTIGGGVALLAFGAGALYADAQAANLTDEINSLSIAGNLNADQTQKLTGYLYDLAGSSMYAATEVAGGFTLMMGKGQDLNEIMRYTGQAMVNLAEATGQKGVAGSATLLSSVMQIWSMKGSEAKNVADQLTYAYYHGGQSIDSMQSAYAAVGPIANALGVTFSQVTANIVTMTQAGLSASQAGTAMRYELSSMYEPTQKQANELEFLGIITAHQVTPAFAAFEKQLKAAGGSVPTFKPTIDSLYQFYNAGIAAGTINLHDTFMQWADSLGMLSNKFYDAKGKAIDFTTAQGILISQIEAHSKTPQQFADAMSQMFNVRSGQAMAILIDHTKGLTAQQKALALSTENAGLASIDAGKKMSSQGNQMTALGTTFQHFMGIAGQPFQNMIQGIASSLNTFFTNLIDHQPQVMKFVAIFLGIGAVLGLIVLIAGAISLIGAAIAAIATPVLIVVGVIALLAAGVAFAVMFIKSHFAQVKAFLQPVIDAFHTLMKNMDFGGAINQLKGTWDSLMKTLEPAIPMLKTIGMIILAVVVVAIAIVIAAIIILARAILYLITAALWLLTHEIQLVGWAFDHLGSLIQIIGHVIGFVFSALGVNAHNAAGQITSAFSGLMNFMGSLPGRVGGVFSAIATTIQNFLSGAPQWGANLIQGFINGLLSKLGNLTGALGNIVGTVKNFLGFASPTKEGPGSTAHTWAPSLMSMFIQGIVAGTPGVGAAAHGAAGALSNGFLSPAVRGAQTSYAQASASVNGGNTTVPLVVDSQVLTQIVLNRLTGQLQMSGSGRTNR